METEMPLSTDKDGAPVSGDADQEPRKSPHPHGDKLHELLNNEKLPSCDMENVEEAIRQYNKWRSAVESLQSEGEQRVRDLVRLVNHYKLHIEVDLIMASQDSFLYRSGGQTKVNSTILEEFLPDLISSSIFPGLAKLERVDKGPFKAFSAAYFQGTLAKPLPGAGLSIRTKDHDFTIGRKAWLKASFHEDFPEYDSVTKKVYLAFVAAECKTNLDKTMFQEAAATAHDLHIAVPGARYYLLCEWLDMPPISTAGTDVEQAIILRGKRIGASVRSKFSNTERRLESLGDIRRRLEDHPILPERILRFTEHLRAVIEDTELIEEDVLKRGWF